MNNIQIIGGFKMTINTNLNPMEQIASALRSGTKGLGLEFAVEHTAIIEGEGWYSDTVIVTKPDGVRYQALSPSQVDRVNEDGMWAEVALELLEKITQRGW